MQGPYSSIDRSILNLSDVLPTWVMAVSIRRFYTDHCCNGIYRASGGKATFTSSARRTRSINKGRVEMHYHFASYLSALLEDGGDPHRSKNGALDGVPLGQGSTLYRLLYISSYCNESSVPIDTRIRKRRVLWRRMLLDDLTHASQLLRCSRHSSTLLVSAAFGRSILHAIIVHLLHSEYRAKRTIGLGFSRTPCSIAPHRTEDGMD